MSFVAKGNSDRGVLDKYSYSVCGGVCAGVCLRKRKDEKRKRERKDYVWEGVCLFAFHLYIYVSVCALVCVCVCVRGAVQPGCRYHPSPCHRPRGCWESGRQLPGSDNEGCILISLRCRRLENAAPLLPHHPVQKPINPAIWQQSAALSSGPAAAGASYQLPSSRKQQQK